MSKTVLIAGVILRDGQDQFLLVQERKPKVYGLWNWPAGHVEPGETLQQAAAREAEEETGLKIRVPENVEPIYVGPGDLKTKHLVHLFFGEVLGGNLRYQSSELLNANWFSKHQIEELSKNNKTRGDWVMVGVERALKP